MNNVIETLINNYSSADINIETILSMLIVVLGLSIYEFFVYRYVSHRAFYNKSFNISITILPFFISTIMLCMQSNIVITLGTLGALAIIRYRTAIKDPVDMVYILWSIHIGIICGCKLYELAIITSLVVTILLLLLEHITIGKRPYILLIHTKNDENIEKIIKNITKRYVIKSRNYTSDGIDYTIELTTKNINDLLKELKKEKEINKFSVIEYSSDDLI